jgi:hypothetical protein
MKNEITLHVSYIYNEPHLGPACEKSYTLFQLIKRGYLKMNELPLVYKLGFAVNVTGDETKRFLRETKKIEE